MLQSMSTLVTDFVLKIGAIQVTNGTIASVFVEDFACYNDFLCHRYAITFCLLDEALQPATSYAWA